MTDPALGRPEDHIDPNDCLYRLSCGCVHPGWDGGYSPLYWNVDFPGRRQCANHIGWHTVTNLVIGGI